MKLLSLHIEDYKNIKKQTFSFSNNSGYIALIGLNGSGKSNLLEAISIVFDGIANNNSPGIPFNYRIEYELNGHIYTRTKNLAMKDSIKCKVKDLEYPSSVIACYSGEDLRLWHTAFEKYHMEYFNKAVKQQYSSPRFLYINKYCWEIALISLICSNNAEVKDFLEKVLKISNPIDVELDFVSDMAKEDEFKAHEALRWFKHITLGGTKGINLKTIATSDINIGAKQVPDDEKSKYIFNFLYLLSQPQKNDHNKIDKLIENIKVTINCNDVKVDFENLSEGEKKLILIECITKVLGDKDSLILLDEPDAHTHIAMKKDLLKLISEYEGQTIMTTHSPMFLNKRWNGFNENNIFYMHDGKIDNTELLRHLAELTNNEIDYFEGAFILSSKKILVVEGKNDVKFLRKAIEIFSQTDGKYRKLNDIAMFSANGASDAETIYKQSLEPCINRIEKLVFLFDYDNAGWNDGWKKINAIPTRGTKIIPMFYQDSYPSDSYPTTENDVSAANDGKKSIKTANTYMVEDLFSESVYVTVIEPVISARSHKDFRSIQLEGGASTKDAIKSYIEKNYNTFTNEKYNKFKPVLDELLNVFELN